MVWATRQSVRQSFQYTGPLVYYLLITHALVPCATSFSYWHGHALLSSPITMLSPIRLFPAGPLSECYFLSLYIEYLKPNIWTHQNLQSNPSSCPLFFSPPSLYSMVWHSKHCITHTLSPLQLLCGCTTRVQSWLHPALHYFKSALKQQMWLKIKPLTMPTLSFKDDHKPRAAMWDTKQSLCPFQVYSFSCFPNTMMHLLLSP